jgi:glucokinase
MMVAVADPHVLLADVGGTHVRFALADPAATAPLLEDSIRVQRVDDWPTFTDAARSYLAQCGAHCHQGVFAFAGPVVDGQVRMTNHPWTIAQDAVQEALGLASLELVNDFAAMSLAACLLADGDGEVLGGAGVPRLRADGSQVFAVLGPGTGLGAGALMLHDGEAATLDTEGGHTGFAPADDLQVAVWMRLAARFGRVSNERLLCGSGLANLHRALAEVHGEEGGDLAPEAITAGAAAGDAACTRSVVLFARLLGAFAGDSVLALGAWDGVFLAGGLVQPLLPWLRQPGFRAGFEDKGRFSSRLARVPVIAMTHPHPGLLGAAAFAIARSGRSLLQPAAPARGVPR